MQQESLSKLDNLLQHKKQKKVQISITLDEDILEKVKDISSQTGLSRAEVINSLLRNTIKQGGINE